MTLWKQKKSLDLSLKEKIYIFFLSHLFYRIQKGLTSRLVLRREETDVHMTQQRDSLASLLVRLCSLQSDVGWDSKQLGEILISRETILMFIIANIQ